MAIREFQRDLVWDMLKEPFRGHALHALMDDAGYSNKLDFTGSYSFQTEEEYNALTWHDFDLPDEEKAMDPVTGFYKNKRTFEEIRVKYPNLPTFAEVEAEYQTYVAEYNNYSGKRERIPNYPSWKEQMDMLYHDIESGLLGEAAKTSSFYTTLKGVKDTYN